MATKVTGLGDNFYVAGYDVSGATRQLAITSPLATIDATDITQSANARLPGLRSGEMNIVTYLDTQVTNSAHALYSSLPTTDVIGTYFRGTAVGNPAASIVARDLNYDFTRANTGELTAQVHLQSDGSGVEWGTQLTAGKRTDTTATVGTAFDLASFYPSPVTFPIAFGAQAYLQIFSFAGTDVTVNITHCTTSGGSYSTLMSFAQNTSTSPSAQRISVSNTTTVNEFIKVTTTTSGGFTSLVFAVMMNLNTTSGVVF